MPLSTPIATLCTDPSYKPRLKKVASGYTGRRIYDVDTTDEERALGATGLPVIGDAWSAGLTSLLAVGIEPEFDCGIDDAATGIGGRCKVAVEYSSIAGGGGGLPVIPGPAVKFSTIEDEVGQETAYFPPGDAPSVGPPQPPVNNGHGMPVLVGKTVVRAVCYYATGTLTAAFIRSLLAIRRTLNDADVTLPALYGVGPALVMAAGEAFYRTYRIAKVGDLLEVTHEIEIALSHDYLWCAEDEDGLQVGSEISTPRYLQIAWPAMF